MNGRVLLSRVDMRGYGGWVINCDGRLTRAGDCRSHLQQSGFPRGSWRETCADPVWDGRVIRASCQTMRGDWRAASFDTNFAFFGLSNCNGELVGSVACGDRAEDGFPPGNWSSYCRDAAVIDGILRASCIHRGEWGPRALNIRGHEGPVSFCDGAISRLPRCP